MVLDIARKNNVVIITKSKNYYPVGKIAKKTV